MARAAATAAVALYALWTPGRAIVASTGPSGVSMRSAAPRTPRSSTRIARTSGVGRAAPQPWQRQCPRWPSVTIE